MRLSLVFLLALLVSCSAPSAPTPKSPTRTPHSTQALQPPTATPPPLPTLSATPLALPQASQTAAMLPDFAPDAEGFPGVTQYWIDAEVTFEPQAQRATINGIQRIRFTNRSDRSLLDIVFMLWPNDAQYRAEMQAGPALIDGQLLPPVQELGGLVQRYELPEALKPGGSIEVSLPFQVTASGPIGGQTPHRFGITKGALFAPTFYPLVPRLIEGEWDARMAPAGGDTTVSEVALYQVRLSAPSDQVIVATGVEIEREVRADATQMVTYVTGPVRDFAFAMGPFITEARQVDGIEVAGWALPGHETDLVRMVDAAAKQVDLLQDLIGPYPYAELDLVDVPGAYGGIEYPGLVTVGTLGGRNVIDPTVHEVGHQWFYGLIGGDQLEEPWLDEGAATYSEVLYHEQFSRRGTATGILSTFRSQVRGHSDPELPIGLGVDDYSSPPDYGLFVYLKGALFFDALRAELGDERFFQFLRDYLETYRYAIASANDFQALAEAACDCDLSSLFDLWVYEGGEIPGL